MRFFEQRFQDDDWYDSEGRWYVIPTNVEGSTLGMTIWIRSSRLRYATLEDDIIDCTLHKTRIGPSNNAFRMTIWIRSSRLRYASLRMTIGMTRNDITGRDDKTGISVWR